MTPILAGEPLRPAILPWPITVSPPGALSGPTICAARAVLSPTGRQPGASRSPPGTDRCGGVPVPPCPRGSRHVPREHRARSRGGSRRWVRPSPARRSRTDTARPSFGAISTRRSRCRRPLSRGTPIPRITGKKWSPPSATLRADCAEIDPPRRTGTTPEDVRQPLRLRLYAEWLGRESRDRGSDHGVPAGPELAASPRLLV